MDILKNILKLAVGLLAGILIGLTFAGVGVVLFTDRTAAQFISSLGGADMLEVIYAAVAGVMFFLISLSVIIITHEAGHLMCGLMSGYRFVSFRIFNYTILRSNGHFRLKRFAVAVPAVNACWIRPIVRWRTSLYSGTTPEVFLPIFCS